MTGYLVTMVTNCSETVAIRGHERSCALPAVVYEHDRWWCARHAPSRVAKRERRKQQRKATIEAERRAAGRQRLRAEQARRKAEREACAGVPDPQPGELLKLRKLVQIIDETES